MPTRSRRTRQPESAAVASQLAWFYRRNGYLRRCDPLRRELLGSRAYKRGDEIRLVANSAEELALIRRLLHEAGFRPGAPFGHSGQHRQPVYGREAVRRFLELVGARGSRRRARLG